MSDRPRRTQGERRAETRAALLAAARELFGVHGFADVGTERLVRAAGVTRGALYHHFSDKVELFAAVLEEVEAELVAQMAAAAEGIDPDDAATLLMAGADAFLDACADPAIQRVVLIDGPAVLGWDRWREIVLRHSLGLVTALIADGIERGSIPHQPVDALTYVLMGAVDEAAIYVARHDDPRLARVEVQAVFSRLIAAVTAHDPDDQ